jgi:hypothetical protein
MKKVKLVLLGLSVATMGLVSCEVEGLLNTEQIQGKTNSLRFNHKDSIADQNKNQKEAVRNKLLVYKACHGDKGDSRPKGDD